MRPTTVIKALLTVIFWGASFVATKIALRDATPIVVVTLRFALGVIVLFAALRLRRQRLVVDRRDWPILIVLAFNGIWFHQMLQATGLAQGASATNTGWYVAIIPVFAVILAAIFLKESIGPIKIIGIVLASLGVLLVVSMNQTLKPCLLVTIRTLQRAGAPLIGLVLNRMDLRRRGYGSYYNNSSYYDYAYAEDLEALKDGAAAPRRRSRSRR